MSDWYLPLALVATFGAVILGAVVLNLSIAERKRMTRLLETQLGDTTNLRKRTLNNSLAQRALVPNLSRLADFAKRVTARGVIDRLETKLALAGNPRGWRAETVAAAKFVAAFAGIFVGLAFAQVLGAAGPAKLALMLLGAGMGFFGPDAMLSSRAEDRQDAIRKVLPDTIDLLTISVEAGLGFDAALQQVMGNVKGPLSEEFSRVLQEMRLGVNRTDAFRHLAERTDVEELSSFILAMVQAERFGVSIANVLRAQSSDLRVKRRQRAEELAMKVPVKILFPMIFCVLPAMFVIVLGPGVIRLAENLFGLKP